MTRDHSGGRLAALKGLFAKKSDPYAGADLANARRITALSWLLATGVGLILVPLSPSQRGGVAGWLLLMAMAVGACAVCGWLLDQRRRATFNVLLGLCYLAVIVLVVA